MKALRLLSIVLILSLAVGCAAQPVQNTAPAAGERAAAPEVAAAQEGVSLIVAGWASSDAEDAALNAQLAEFTAKTGIKAEFVPSPDYNVTKQTAFASGKYANVFYIDSSALPDWVEAGVVDMGEGKIENPEGFYASLLDVFTYDGSLYCAPKDFATMGLEYNRDLFDAAGLEYPNSDWTWEDLRAAAEALTDKEAGVIGLVTPTDIERWMPFMYQAGGAIFDAQGDFIFDSPETLKALEFYVGLVQDGLAGPPSVVDAGWGGEAFGQGRAAMAMEGGWVIKYLLDQFPDLNWGVAELPTGDAGKATMAFTVCFGVAANNEYPEESWQLVNFLTGEEQQMKLGENGFGSMPARIAAADAYRTAWQKQAEGTGFDAAGIDAFVAGASYGHKWQLPVGWQAFVETFKSNMQLAFDGQLTAKDVLTEAARVGQELQSK